MPPPRTTPQRHRAVLPDWTSAVQVVSMQGFCGAWRPLVQPPLVISMKWLIRTFFKTVRALLGPVMLLWEKLSAPKGMVRSPEQQQRVDAETRNLTLYQFRTCPFCIKVRRTIKRLSLNIETRDAQRPGEYREELLRNGGAVKVPCLRVVEGQGERWLYESGAIIAYLEQHYR